MAVYEWPGNEQEKDRFLRAVAKNCECRIEEGVLAEVCRSHLLLAPNKQNFEYWQHLVYSRRLWTSDDHGFLLRQEEFGPQGIVEHLPPYRRPI